jgi:hypothetical protein
MLSWNLVKLGGTPMSWPQLSFPILPPQRRGLGTTVTAYPWVTIFSSLPATELFKQAITSYCGNQGCPTILMLSTWFISQVVHSVLEHNLIWPYVAQCPPPSGCKFMWLINCCNSICPGCMSCVQPLQQI